MEPRCRITWTVDCSHFLVHGGDLAAMLKGHFELFFFFPTESEKEQPFTHLLRGASLGLEKLKKTVHDCQVFDFVFFIGQF